MATDRLYTGISFDDIRSWTAHLKPFFFLFFSNPPIKTTDSSHKDPVVECRIPDSFRIIFDLIVLNIPPRNETNHLNNSRMKAD